MLKTLSLTLFGIFFSMLLSSCNFLHDYNSDLEKYPEIDEIDDTTGLEVATLTEEDLQKRQLVLENIAKEPYPLYKIDVGDTIALRVYNHPDMDFTTPVTPDGHIGIPFIGQIKIAGLTIPEAAKAVETGLTPYLKNMAVGITPVSMPSQQATIAGAVNKTGMYPVSSGMRISELFALAGGGQVRLFDGKDLDVADFPNSMFFRNGQILPVDFLKAIELGDPLNNIEVRKGDYIYIKPRTESMVSVVGEVMRPTFQMWNSGMRILDAITNSGGLTESYWRYAILIRGGIQHPRFYRVDLDLVLTGQRHNPKLLAGDIVYIPKDSLSYYNVFIRKLLPTGQLYNMIASPVSTYSAVQSTSK